MMDVTLRDFDIDDVRMDSKARDRLNSMHEKARRRFRVNSQPELRKIRRLAMERFSTLEGFMGIDIKEGILRIFFNNRESAISFPDVEFHGLTIERRLYGSNQTLITREENEVRNVQRSKT